MPAPQLDKLYWEQRPAQGVYPPYGIANITHFLPESLRGEQYTVTLSLYPKTAVFSYAIMFHGMRHPFTKSPYKIPHAEIKSRWDEIIAGLAQAIVYWETPVPPRSSLWAALDEIAEQSGEIYFDDYDY